MARRRKGDAVDGWLILDKPAGPTSTDVLARARRLLNAAKAGHAGTLDPIATGVLPVAFGEATKTVPYAMDGEKVYRFTVRWGQGRDTDDTEGRIIAESPVRPTRAQILALLPRFTGDILQVPPAYSAVKIAGERAYDLARDGEEVRLDARWIRIDSLDLVDIPGPDEAVFEAVCGKGAYMRGLARDLGRALGTFGHLAAIRRLRVGPFGIDRAITLENLAALAEKSAARSALISVATPLDDIPAVAVAEAEAHRLRSGQSVALLRRSDRERLSSLALDPSDGDAMVLAVLEGTPVAIARLDGAELRPVRVFHLKVEETHDVDHR